MHIEYYIPWATLKVGAKNRAEEIDRFHADGYPNNQAMVNLTPACPHCNMSKGSKSLHTWDEGIHLQ